MADNRKPTRKYTPAGSVEWRPGSGDRPTRPQGRPVFRDDARPAQGRVEGRYGKPAGDRREGGSFQTGHPRDDKQGPGFRPGAPAQGRGGAGFPREGGQGSRGGYRGEREGMSANPPRGPQGQAFRSPEGRAFTPRGDRPQGQSPRPGAPQDNRRGFVQDTPERGHFQGRFTRGPAQGHREGSGPSPASQRFGPGSRPGQIFGRPAPMAQANPQRPEGEAVGEQRPETSPYHEESLANVNLLSGRNPIREALKAGRDLEKLMIAKGELTGSAREIVAMAKDAGVMIQAVERTRLDQITNNHQGMVAFASAYNYSSMDDILALAKERGEEPFIIILDQITDPHNLGAVIRTASCAGAHGVIVPMHRAVGLTPAAVRASAGAVEHVKVARVTNINQAIKALQQQKIWVYAADMNGEDYRKVSFQGPCALVIGSEGEGVSPLTLSICDKRVRIPMRGPLDSLNASVAAGILMYAVFGTRG